MQRLPVEIRWEGLRDKVRRTSGVCARPREGAALVFGFGGVGLKPDLRGCDWCCPQPSPSPLRGRGGAGGLGAGESG